jgi:ascorbate-specific PTS system EIIC-type component UlaA
MVYHKVNDDDKPYHLLNGDDFICATNQHSSSIIINNKYDDFFVNDEYDSIDNFSTNKKCKILKDRLRNVAIIILILIFLLYLKVLYDLCILFDALKNKNKI